MSTDPRRPIVVVMGVSGVGKSAVGEQMAACLNEPYRDGDTFHSAANIAKMEAGHPLDDADRLPWLDAIRDWCEATYVDGRGGVVSCSALKRSYRDRLREGTADLWFLDLQGSADVIRAHLSGRAGHFMPPSLLESQLDTLEPLQPDEPGTTLEVDHSIDELVDAAIDALDAWRDTSHDPSSTG